MCLLIVGVTCLQYQGRGVLTVAAPSKSNGWIGEVESSIELQPYNPDGHTENSFSRPHSAASVVSTRSMPEMGMSKRGSRVSIRRSRDGSRVASQGAGAIVGRRKLQVLNEEEQQLKKMVAAVKARGGVGEGWRLYAPGLHVGLSCKTDEHIVEKNSFANGLYSGVWGGTRRGGDIGRPTTPGAAVVGSREANATNPF
jgi:hypothetical protein